MMFGGVAVDDRLVRRLTPLVGKSLRDKLDRALVFRAEIVGLTREEQTAILVALESAPGELGDLRDLLAADTKWPHPRRVWG